MRFVFNKNIRTFITILTKSLPTAAYFFRIDMTCLIKIQFFLWIKLPPSQPSPTGEGVVFPFPLALLRHSGYAKPKGENERGFWNYI